MKKHLLKMMDLSCEEIIEILNLADQLKYELVNGIPHPILLGKSLGMIFPVSYTHLDVYKRQALNGISSTFYYANMRVQRRLT